MKYSNVIYNDLVNAIGTSLTFYCQGCSHHCDGCFNKQTWDFDGGNEFNQSVLDEMMSVVKLFDVVYDNLVLLGGEPFDNIETCVIVANEFKSLFPNKKIWVYSGYRYDEIIQYSKKLELLKRCDVLIDGRFIKDLYDPYLKFRGSSNQRIINVQESLKLNKVVELEL